VLTGKSDKLDGLLSAADAQPLHLPVKDNDSNSISHESLEVTPAAKNDARAAHPLIEVEKAASIES
jgi:hypothetical protein